MKNIPIERQTIVGREHIVLTDAFFELPYVKKYMNENSYTKETLPALVLQQSHGDHVV